MTRGSIDLFLNRFSGDSGQFIYAERSTEDSDSSRGSKGLEGLIGSLLDMLGI